MLHLVPESKIVAFAVVPPPALPLVCRGCGAVKHSGGVCRPCARYLVDLALSSVDDNFPQALEDDQPNELGAFAPRTRYDHYEICQNAEGNLWELGRGAMGITYKATDTNLGMPVALKIINTHHLSGVNGRERFLREARTAARLRHPHIASVFHLGLGEGQECFYAMEFIAGETLEAHVRRTGPLAGELALDVVMQAAYALRVAHQQGFIHRDIKPTNLMLVESEKAEPVQGGPADKLAVKLIDFGLVKAVTEEAAGWTTLCQGYFAGTPFYASPEQLDSGTVDARSDIYSLGRCLEFTLAGSTLGVLTEVAREGSTALLAPPARPDVLLTTSVPTPLRALVASMTAEDPTRRPQSAAELLQQIQGCRAALRLAGQPAAFHKVGNMRKWLGIATTLLVGFAVLLGRSRVIPDPEASLARPSSAQDVAHREARLLYADAEQCRFRLTKADNQRAIELYSQAASRVPEFADAHASLALAFYQGVSRFGEPPSQLDLAVNSAHRAIALRPNVPDAYRALAAVHVLRGQPWEALTQLHRALELNPTYLPVIRDFSLQWTSVGRPQLGFAWAKAAAEMEPMDLYGWSVLADASTDLGADQEAERCYRRCLQIKPSWVAGVCGLMHVHLLQGDFAQARQDCDLARSIDPDSIFPLTLQAQLALFNGAYAEAEQDYRRLLTMNRHGLVVFYGGISYLSALGFLRCQAGDLAEGQTLLEEAAKLRLNDSDGPQAIYDLAAVRSVQGRTEEALILLQQAVTSGWLDYRSTEMDPRFSALRTQPRFTQLLQSVGARVAQMRQEAERLSSKPLSLAECSIEDVRK